MISVSSLISKLTANQRLLLHHVILVLRNISAHESVTRMTSANLAVCVAPALLWRGRRAYSLQDAQRALRDVGSLSVVVQRIVDADDAALFGDDPGCPTPFADLSVTASEQPSFDHCDALTGTAAFL